MADYLYIHVPFCKTICFYCDFTHRIYDSSIVDKWLIELDKEIKSKNINKDLKTIYIGGGTPSCLNTNQLESLLKLLEPYSKKIQEYTIEVNPETLTQEKVLLFKKYAINRVSLGIQSFNDEILSSLNRRHTKDDVLKCITLLRENDITNITCDLMYSLPNQTLDMFMSDIKELVDLKIPHISFYSLTIEDNTVFKLKGIKAQDEDIEASMYESANKYLIDNNYKQYEVSNYCLDNYESKHNKAYWLYEDFYGLSIGASAKLNHKRIENTKDFNEYFKSNYIKEEIVLSKEDEMFENLMMSLRLKEGLDLKEFKRRYNVDFKEVYKDKLDKAIALKQVDIINEHLVCLNREILNTVLVNFMD